MVRSRQLQDAANRNGAAPNPGRMANDHDNENEEEPKLFTLTEAERTRREVEPVLIEAIETNRKLQPLDEELSTLAARIQTMGGIPCLTSTLRACDSITIAWRNR